MTNYKLSNELETLVKSSREYANSMHSIYPTPVHLLVTILEHYMEASSIDGLEDLKLYRYLTETLPYGSVKALQMALPLISGKPPPPPGLPENILDLDIFLEKYLPTTARSLRYEGDLDCSMVFITCLRDEDLSVILESIDIKEQPFMKSMNNKFEKSFESVEDSFADYFHSGIDKEESENRSAKELSKLETLRKYSVCMTDKAKNKQYDPVVGRQSELDKLQEILCCRKKNNAVLLGDPGVGKTAIVEALAQRIVDNKVPRQLLGKEIFSLNLNSLVSGTMYRGQFEERLQKIIEEVIAAQGKIIIYIDEFHNLIGAGSSSGNGDAANILKPYLSRGEFQCIGSTTLGEYRKYIEKDGALKRRFQEVNVGEPSKEETVKILINIKEAYQKFHGVSYTDEVIEHCVNLSDRFISDRYFPDKAIDILDLAGSKLKLSKPFSASTIKSLKKKIEAAKKNKMKAVENQDFELAAQCRDEQVQLEAQLKTETEISEVDPGNRLEITEDLINQTISEITGVPASKLGQSDLERIKGMNDVMSKIVIGQGEAIEEISLSLQRNSLGFRDPSKPIATFMFVGPTGTGKTFLAKTLAKEFFGSENSIVRIDCSTLSENHAVASLTGSQPGYVGYDDQNILDQVRTKRYCVVLFDEIEKANQSVKQSLLSVLDDGYITKGNGIKIDFRNTIIIFTSNTGTQALQLHGSGLGFQRETDEEARKTGKAIVNKEIQKHFSPEFINRFTSIVHFKSLGKEDMESVCQNELQKLIDRILGSKTIKDIQVAPEVIEKIVTECDTKFGARDLQRKIIDNIEKPLTQKILGLASLSGLAQKTAYFTVSEDKVEVNFK